MILTIDREMLLAGLERVVGVVEARSVVPILCNIHLEACASVLRLMATDLNIEVSVPVPAEVTTQGVITVNSRMFTDIVRKSTSASGRISMAWVEPVLQIRAGRACFKLATLPADDFPQMQIKDSAEDRTFEIECRELRDLFEATRWAASSDETRYYLQGTHLCQDGEQLVAVATDGHRMSLKKIPLPPRASGMSGAIVPRKTMAEILKLLPNNDTMCEMTLSRTFMRIELGDAVLVSKLIDGTYPDYKRVIPEDNPIRAIIPRKVVEAAAARVGTVLDSAGNPLALEYKGGELRITADGSIGKAEDLVDEVVASGGDVRVSVNSRYLFDVLKAFDGEQLAIAMKDAGAPLRFEQVDGDGSRLVMLMPMRVSDNFSMGD